MKLQTIVPVVAALAGAVNAKALLAVFPDEVTIGKSYFVEWLADASESLELLVVKKTSYGWKPVKTLFEGRVGHWPNDNYTWQVDNSYEPGSGYGLWLSSTPIPDRGSGYADLTKWFDIVAAEKEDLKV